MALLIVGVLRANDRTHGTAVVPGHSRRWQVAAYCVLDAGLTRTRAFDGAFVADGFARFSKLLILLGAALTL